MQRRRGDARSALPAAAAYGFACLMLAAGAWFAVGTAAAQDVPAPTATVADSTDSDAPSLEPIEPTATPDPTPSATWTPWPDSPTPTAAPVSVAAPFVYDIYKDNTFVSQFTKYACTAGAAANMLNIIGPKVDKSTARQEDINVKIVQNTTKEDSHNGGYGPEGWAITLTQLGGGNYKLIVDDNIDQALHDAVVALRKTGRPVGLLAWWGAHSWVMTGFRTSRDPRRYSTFTIYGAYIVDPYYPRHSSIWGYTLGPDTFRNMAEMKHNYVGWKRPEGKYPGRDGRWLLVVPY